MQIIYYDEFFLVRGGLTVTFCLPAYFAHGLCRKLIHEYRKIHIFSASDICEYS